MVVGSVFGLGFGNARATWRASRWPSLRSLRSTLFVGLVVGLVVGLFAGLVFGLVFGLVVGLVGGLVFGLVFGLVVGLIQSSEVVGQVSIDAGLRLSRRSFLRSILVFGLVFGLGGILVVGLVAGLVGGLVFGLVVGLDMGGWYLVLQVLLRRRLRRLGLFPARGQVEPFFGLMSDVGLVRRLAGGGSVRFAHDLLRDHLADILPPGSWPAPQLSGLVDPSSPQGDDGTQRP